jgi:hypothetical protein
VPAPRPSARSGFLPWAVAAAVVISAVSVHRFLEVTRAGGQIVLTAAAGGQPRDVDVEQIETMIRQRRLSDREAEYYEKADQAPPRGLTTVD